MFPIIKLFVAHFPNIKLAVLDASRDVQDKAKNIIVAAKQARTLRKPECA
jgi:hypothetical protein